MDNEFSRKIKELRLQRKMTLEQVGDIVGVGKSTVRKWETGMIANMRRDKIGLLAQALGTTPAYLMGWEDDKTTPPITITEGERELLNLFRMLPDEAQKLYLQVLRTSLKNQS